LHTSIQVLYKDLIILVVVGWSYTTRKRSNTTYLTKAN
jgi:hypothetical protein